MFESIRHEPSPTRAATRARERWLAIVGITGAIAIFFVLGGARAGTRSSRDVVATAIGWIIVAAFASWLAFSRQKHGMGVAREWRVLAALATSPVLMIAFVLSSGDRTVTSPYASGICFAATLAMGFWPLGAMLLARRGSDPTHPRATAAAIGAACGAWASVLIDLHCSSAAIPHVAIGHALPTLILALFGALVGSRVLGIRAR